MHFSDGTIVTLIRKLLVNSNRMLEDTGRRENIFFDIWLRWCIGECENNRIRIMESHLKSIVNVIHSSGFQFQFNF